MTTRLRAHFDGKVIVPDETVDIPLNAALTVELQVLSEAHGQTDASTIADRLHKLAGATGHITGPGLSDAAFLRDNLYNERW